MTTSPGKTVDVNGVIRSNNEIIGSALGGNGQFRAISGNYGLMVRNDGSNTYFLLTNSGNQYGGWNNLRPFRLQNEDGSVIIGEPALFVQHAGNVGIGTIWRSNYKLYVNGPAGGTGSWQASDQRWKKNIAPIDRAISLVEGLQGVRFDWRADEFKDINFDEGKQIGLIAQDVEKVLPEIVKTDSDGYKAVAYEKLTAVLVEAIKEQQKQILSMRAEIEQLKAEQQK